MRKVREGSIQMTADEAKEVIRNDPTGDIRRRLDAIAVALEELGENATMKEIYKWSEEVTKDCKT